MKWYDGLLLICLIVGLLILFFVVNYFLYEPRIQLTTIREYEKVEPRGPQVMTNILEYEPWKPTPSTGTTTIPAATNEIPKKYEPQTCYQFLNERVCQ